MATLFWLMVATVLGFAWFSASRAAAERAHAAGDADQRAGLELLQPGDRVDVELPAFGGEVHHLAARHPGRPDRAGELTEQPYRLVRDPVLGVIEVEPCALGRETLAATGIGGTSPRTQDPSRLGMKPLSRKVAKRGDRVNCCCGLVINASAVSMSGRCGVNWRMPGCLTRARSSGDTDPR